MFLRLRNVSLTTWIFISLMLGVSAGILFGDQVSGLKFIGDIWLNLIKLIIVPLVFVILMQAIVGNGRDGGVGKIVVACLPYYVFTTLMAALIGSVLAYFIQPGEGLSLDLNAIEAPISTPEFTVEGFLSGLVSSNLFSSLTEANMLQVLVISVLLGISVRMIPDTNARVKIADALTVMSEWVFAYLRIAIALSPIGVFFLMAATVGENGGALLGSIAELLGVFYSGALIQILVVYGGSVWIATKLSPMSFLSRASELWMFAIATTSSVASIPVNLDVADKQFSVRRRIREFVIPLGSQINSDGNALLLPAVVVLAATATGVDVGLGYLMQAVLIAIVISFAGGGIPGGGIVRILIVLQFFGLPLEIGAMVAGFYRFFDMGTTTTNVLGDLTGAIVTNRLVGESIERTEERESISYAD
ncbi:dicarboxylate/amino acid:cation symporter [Salinicola corii]|uniref:Dicarboxylate/amino acid:cation symporter n=1 Tax=Salinicola corii TaxID=2606937 RepID=A0A640W9U0_9GAMM|nr:dicarboxylate/amino acid:cation symporter [Salinicola corii]KAA0015081.1 dicarboxylate/amino acid:cation symporter [Salinicola corii]